MYWTWSKFKALALWNRALKRRGAGYRLRENIHVTYTYQRTCIQNIQRSLKQIRQLILSRKKIWTCTWQKKTQKLMKRCLTLVTIRETQIKSNEKKKKTMHTRRYHFIPTRMSKRLTISSVYEQVDQPSRMPTSCCWKCKRVEPLWTHFGSFLGS